MCVSLILSTWAIWFRPMHVSASEDNSIEDLVGRGQPKQGNGALRMTTTPTPTWSAPTQSPSRTPTPYPPLTMPDVVGMNYVDAMDLIREKLAPPVFDEIKFQIGWVLNNDPDRTLTVATQEPQAGSLQYGNHSSRTFKLVVYEHAPTPTPTPDYSGYTVTLLPGEGTGDPVVYRFDDQENVLGWRDAGIYQFYYEDNGDLGFRSSRDRFPDSFTPPEGYLFDGFQNGAYHVLKQKETSINAEWTYNIEYWLNVPSANFVLSAENLQLTGGGNSEFTLGFKSLDLGRVPIDEIVPTLGTNPENYYYKRAQGLEIYDASVSLLENANGDTIPLSFESTGRQDAPSEIIFDPFNSDKDTFSFSIYVKPDDFKKANPGEYHAELVFYYRWDLGDSYSDDSLIPGFYCIPVTLIVPEPDPVPSVPTSVKATAVSASSIRITWEANEEAEGYQVWRSTSETGSFTNLGTIIENEKLSVGLKANTTYYYKVRAYRQIDGTKYYSDFTPVISTETLLAKPVGVKVASASGTSVKVTWNAVAGADGYQVWRGLSSTGSFTALGSFNTTEKVSTGLVTGTTYYYKVRAYRVVEGKKVYSDYSAVVSAAPKLYAPSGVKAVPDTTTGINISWNKLSGATGYQVWRGTSATGTFTAIGSVTTTSRVSTGLKAGTTYYYKVRAYKEVNGKKIYGDFSAVVSASTKPAAPSGVKTVVASATKVKVSWNASNGAAGYEVWRSDSTSGTYTKLGTVATTSRDCPGLTKGKTYYFKVRAYVEVNGTKYYSNYSSVVSATPKA